MCRETKWTYAILASALSLPTKNKSEVSRHFSRTGTSTLAGEWPYRRSRACPLLRVAPRPFLEGKVHLL